MPQPTKPAALVCHLTTVHPRNDVRVYHKQCKALAAAGFRVVLVVADGKGDEMQDGVEIKDLGAPRNRIERLTVSARACYRKAMEIPADLFQIHDPELLPVAFLLQHQGKRVIFDSHEITPMSIRSKTYLPEPVRFLASKGYSALETRIVRDLEAVLIPQDLIMSDYFQRRTKRVQLVRNFVALSEYPEQIALPTKNTQEQVQLIYAGGLAVARGLTTMLEVAHRLGERCTLTLAGRFADQEEFKAAKQHPGWSRVDYKGLVDRETLAKLYQEAHIGLILFEPTGQYGVVESPLKLYEYLLFGLPTITPSFPVWKSFERKHGVTRCVDTSDISGICDAILAWTKEPQTYRALALDARKVVQEHYSWEAESKRFVSFYQELCQAPKSDGPSLQSVAAS